MGTLMHMGALDANGRRVKVEINTPEGRPERIRQAWRSLIVQGVGFTEDHRRRVCVASLHRIILGNVSVDRGCGDFVVHEGAL